MVDASLADTFISVLIGGSDVKDRPFNKLRESLIKSKILGNMSIRHDSARAIKAFNYEMTGSTPKVLMWTSSMDYPSIQGLDIESI